MLITKNNFNDKYCFSPYSKCSHGCLYCYFNHSNKDSIPKFDRDDISFRISNDLKKIPISEQIVIGVDSDAYPPIEEKLKLTRETIKTLVYEERSFKVCTKSDLVLRDIDLFKKNREQSTVSISLCSSDNSVLAVLEPKAPNLNKRISAINELINAGINVEVDASPWIPGILNIKKMIKLLPENIRINIFPLRNSNSSFSKIDENSILENYLKEIERFPTNPSVIWNMPN